MKRLILLIAAGVLISSLTVNAQEITPTGDATQAVADEGKDTEEVNDSTSSTSLTDEELETVVEDAIESTLNESNTSTVSQSSNSTRWVPDESRTTTLKFTCNPQEVKKFEIFYSGDATVAPKLVFMSPNNQIINPGNDITTAELYFVTRSDYTASNYPDINYDNIYIEPLLDEYAGEWTVSITLDESVTEFVFLECKADDGWENFVEEYKATPLEVKLWYIEDPSGWFGVNDVKALCLRDETTPESNNLGTYVEPPKEKKNYLPTVIVLIILAIIGLVAGIVFLYKKFAEAHKERREYEISIQNKNLKKKRKRENDKLSGYLDTYDDDYSDDEVMENAGTVESFMEDDDEERYIPTAGNIDDSIKIKGTVPVKKASPQNVPVKDKKKAAKQNSKQAKSAAKNPNKKNSEVNKPNNGKPVSKNNKKAVNTNNAQVASNNSQTTKKPATNDKKLKRPVENPNETSKANVQKQAEVKSNAEQIPVMPQNVNTPVYTQPVYPQMVINPMVNPNIPNVSPMQGMVQGMPAGAMMVNGQVVTPVYVMPQNGMPMVAAPYTVANPTQNVEETSEKDKMSEDEKTKADTRPSWMLNDRVKTKEEKENDPDWQKKDRENEKKIIF